MNNVSLSESNFLLLKFGSHLLGNNYLTLINHLNDEGRKQNFLRGLPRKLKNIENKQVQALHPSEGPKENKIQVLISSIEPGK